MILSPGIVVKRVVGEAVELPASAGNSEFGNWSPRPLRCVDQHQFGIFQRRDLELRLIADGETVAGADADAVDFDLAGSGHEVEMARFVRRVMRALARLQC